MGLINVRGLSENSSHRHTPPPLQKQNTSLSDTLNIARLDQHNMVLNRTASVGPDVLYSGHLQGKKKRYPGMFVAFQRVYTLKQRGHIQSETWFLVEQRGADQRSIDSACVSHQHETCNGPDIRLKHFIKPSVCSPLCSSVLYTVVTGSTTRSLMMSCSPCVTRQQNKDLN